MDVNAPDIISTSISCPGSFCTPRTPPLTDVRRGWTVAELAKHAGMSRSAFATRFVATVGCAPMEYLLKWRMSLAQVALSRGRKSLDHLAEEIGYEAASAFSTAFRRRLGCPPGAFARSLRRARQSAVTGVRS